MKTFTDKKVLVTGAGSGIGRETAMAFAAKGAHVIATGLGQDGLAGTRSLIEQNGGRCEVYSADVSDEAAMRALADEVHGRFGAVGRFLDTSVATWDRVWAINVKGVMLGCKLFVPPMIERRSGHVVNLSSMAGFFAAPDMAVYAASKYAVLGFSEALRGDLQAHGIGVTAVCPGLVNTSIVATSTAEGGAAGWQGNAVDFYARRNYPPSKVATAILQAVRRNTAVCPVTPEAWVTYHAKRLLPGLTRTLAARPLPFMKNA